MTLILFGQPALASALKLPAMIPLAQRIGAWVSLTGMGEEETVQYIDWQVQRAGGKNEIFSPAAKKALFRRSQGSPGNQAIVDAYLEHAAGRKALAFTVDVQHAEDLASAFRENGIEAKALSGRTPEEERRETLQAFSSGEIQVIANCALLTEGYDEPSINCILMARPTKSATLYTQCIGRGTRLFPGKQDCLVIDFADNRHDVCALPTLLGFGLDRLTKR